MKFCQKILIAFAAILLSNIVVSAQATKTVTVVTTHKEERVFNPAFKGKPEAEIESLEHKLSDAILSSDSATLNEMYSDDVAIAGLIGTKAQFIAYMKQLMKQSDKTITAIEKSEMRIQLHGNTAVATGRLTIDSKTADGAGTSVNIFMNVWSKDPSGKWLCIATLG